MFERNSGRFEGVHNPIGYLKAASNMASVNLYILPYNYPELFGLVEELRKLHKITPNWRSRFDQYKKKVPVYYMKVGITFEMIEI